MKVKCINDKNTKLIKGQIYEALEIVGKRAHETNKNITYYSHSYILLENGNSYTNLSRFRTLDGKSLDFTHHKRECDEDSSNLSINKYNISGDELKGQWIYCKNGVNNKYFITGNYYKIDDIKLNRYDYVIKIEGIDNYYTSNRFRLLSKREKRDIKIDIINGLEVVSSNFTRKFDTLSTNERTHVIINKLNLARKVMLKNNFKNTQLEKYIIKNDKEFGIKLSDIQKVKKMKISDLFNI